MTIEGLGHSPRQEQGAGGENEDSTEGGSINLEDFLQYYILQGFI